MPESLIEPIWSQFVVVLPNHPVVDSNHPLDCHRRRISGRIVFDQVLAPLVHGSGYERIAEAGCSCWTILRCVRALADAGANRHDSPLLAPTLACLAPVGVDPAATTIHLDRGYDHGGTRTLLEELGFTGEIARKGVPAPIQVCQRRVVERTHAWMNGYGKLRRCTEKTQGVVELYLYLAAAIVVTRCLIQRARTRYRWDGRPTTRRLK